MTKRHIHTCAAEPKRDLPEHIHVLYALSPAEVPDAEGEGSFSWAMILPAGDKIDARDGRVYLNPNPKALVDLYNSDPVDIMVDTNHDSVFSNWDPAAHGWVKEMEVRDGAVWGNVEWTDRGVEVLSKKHYRYLSPAFITDAENNIEKFVSVGLVNQPAMTMPAVARAETPAAPNSKPKTKTKESIVDEEQMAQLRTAYGLADDASAADIIAATLAAAPAAGDTGNADAEAEAAAAAAEAAAAAAAGDTEGAVATGTGDAPDLTQYVPRADYDLVVADRDALKGDADAAPSDADVSEAVDGAIATARIAPASRAHYVAMCSTTKGFDAFKAFAKTGPKVVATAADTSLNTPATAGLQLSAAETAVCRAMGISPEKFIANKKKKGA